MTGTRASLVAVAWLVLAGVGASAQESRVPLPSIPPATKGERCVEPNDVMRREHMNFLLHQRDETVHLGVRGAKHSLVGCIDCHARIDAAGAAIPVDAEGEFCESCHGFAGVEMDCFGCHAAVPAKERAARGTLPEWMSPPTRSMARAGAVGIE